MDKFEFKKSFGQNFLKDKSIVDKIVNVIDYDKNNLVIEIGPGSGAMTKKLLPVVDKMLIYEIDTRLKDILDKELKGYDNYDIIFDDFLNRDIKEDLSKYNYDNLYIVANLPYYITTPIISKIVSSEIDVKEMVLMVQKEVADRLSSKVGSREYGYITVLLNYFFEIDKVFNVSKNCFIPKPNVDSAVIRFRKRDNLLYLKDYKYFDKFLQEAFRYKRKNIKNNLKGYDLDIIEEVLNKYGLNLNSRSEQIDYSIFVEIVNKLIK